MPSPSPEQRLVIQSLVLFGMLLGVGWLFRWTNRKNAIQDSRDGIAASEWERGMKSVGPLGKWQNTPLAKLQRELDALTKEFNRSGQ